MLCWRHADCVLLSAKFFFFLPQPLLPQRARQGQATVRLSVSCLAPAPLNSTPSTEEPGHLSQWGRIKITPGVNQDTKASPLHKETVPPAKDWVQPDLKQQQLQTTYMVRLESRHNPIIWYSFIQYNRSGSPLIWCYLTQNITPCLLRHNLRRGKLILYELSKVICYDLTWSSGSTWDTLTHWNTAACSISRHCNSLDPSGLTSQRDSVCTAYIACLGEWTEIWQHAGSPKCSKLLPLQSCACTKSFFGVRIMQYLRKRDCDIYS